MKMVVTVPLTSVYGKELRAGDQFECSEKEAKLWTALSKAKKVEENSVEVKSEAPSETQEGPEYRRRGRQSGTYARRDMRAED